MGNILKKPKPLQEDEQFYQNQTFTCEICTETISLPYKKFNNNYCTHSLCTDCIINYIQVQLEYEVDEIPCPALTCKQSLDPVTCRSLVGTKLFAKWCDLLYEKALLKMDSCYCPNKNCSVLIVNECGEQTKSSCPSCGKLFCFECKISWHEGLSCDDVDVTDHYLWKRCPKCRFYVQRNGGCDYMYCRCGYRFCYC